MYIRDSNNTKVFAHLVTLNLSGCQIQEESFEKLLKDNSFIFLRALILDRATFEKPRAPDENILVRPIENLLIRSSENRRREVDSERIQTTTSRLPFLDAFTQIDLLPSLETLSLIACDLKSESMTEICRSLILKNIRELYMGETELTLEGLDALMSSPSVSPGALRILDISDLKYLDDQKYQKPDPTAPGFKRAEEKRKQARNELNDRLKKLVEKFQHTRIIFNSKFLDSFDKE
eukprot:TRINITY_DN11080_c0_g1_i1.p1 TRINITY_DN11080_c0_g1~~TRINITY_DN11080_c0_g1_i1.p1  ORF type:complete len:235 (+),score=38.45 TRINITY_DN11080_c0_g1_i1:63-767(+)